MTTKARILGIALMALGPIAASGQQPDTELDPEAAAAEYEMLLRDIRGLQLYNALLRRQIAEQQAELAAVETAIEGVPELERQLPPLLIEMVEALEEFVERDVPFLMDERNEGIANLYNLIENPELSNAVKLRRILETWDIEAQYGREFLEDTGTVEIDGTERNVDFVIVGRVGLLFQTTDDEAITGAWDYRNDSWIILGSEYRNAVRQAIRMARNQIAPELILLPSVPPQPD